MITIRRKTLLLSAHLMIKKVAPYNFCTSVMTDYFDFELLLNYLVITRRLKYKKLIYLILELRKFVFSVLFRKR